jgi:hypothetical protein
MDSATAFGVLLALSQVGLVALVAPPIVLGVAAWLRERRRERHVALPGGVRVTPS